MITHIAGPGKIRVANQERQIFWFFLCWHMEFFVLIHFLWFSHMVHYTRYINWISLPSYNLLPLKSTVTDLSPTFFRWKCIHSFFCYRPASLTLQREGTSFHRAVFSVDNPTVLLETVIVRLVQNDSSARYPYSVHAGSNYFLGSRRNVTSFAI